jgi:hypothetical protein
VEWKSDKVRQLVARVLVHVQPDCAAQVLAIVVLARITAPPPIVSSIMARLVMPTQSHLEQVHHLYPDPSLAQSPMAELEYTTAMYVS